VFSALFFSSGIDMHYYKRNLGDYAKKAGRLSLLQHGAYTVLTDACYDREQFPTLEQAIEWSWADLPDEVDAVKFVLRKFFLLEDGIYVQNRIREEISEYHEKANTNKRIAVDREMKRKEVDTNRERTVNEPPPNHKPLTKNQEPVTSNQEPVTKNQELELKETKSKPSSPDKSGETELQFACRFTWKHFKDAYFNRYNIDPVRNKKVNSQIRQFVERIGFNDSPFVATFFVNHNERFYIQKLHPVDLLLKDCEGLRTQWATNRTMTSTTAIQLDKTASNFDSIAQAKLLMRSRDENR
jgi:uncharacterized protein YdaU (DUF1376 family)